MILSVFLQRNLVSSRSLMTLVQLFWKMRLPGTMHLFLPMAKLEVERLTLWWEPSLRPRKKWKMVKGKLFTD